MVLRKRITLLLAAIMIVSIALAGCGTSTKQTSSKNTGPTVNKQRILRESDWVGWPKPPLFQSNPFGSGGIGIAWMCFDTLYQYTRSTDHIYVRMADGMPKIDGNKMTVKIKQGIKWNDGQPFTSKDVWAYFVMNNGCEIMKYLTDIQTPDDNTVVFIWNNPAPADSIKVLLLAQEGVGQIPYHFFKQYVDKNAEILKMGKPAANIVDRGPFGLDRVHNKAFSDALDKNWQDFIKVSPKKPLGTGPYTLQTVTVSDMILVKNKDYYDAKNVPFDKLVLKQGLDQAGQYASLKNGVVDRFDGTQPKDIVDSMLKSDKNLIHYQMLDPADRGFMWNTRKYPLSDVNFRRALTYIFDREKIKDVGNYYGKAITDYSIMGMPQTFVDEWVPQDVKDKMTKFSYDPNKAEELLKQLGWTKGSDGKWKDKNGKMYNFILAANAGEGPNVNSTEVASEQLRNFGFNAKTMAVDGSIYYTNAQNGKYDTATDWVDVTWSFDKPFFPQSNFWEGSPSKYSGLPKDPKTSWITLKAPGPDGQTVDVGQTLHTLLYMTTDEMKQASGKLVYIANESAYGIDWYQNVTGTWFNMNTVKYKDGWPMANQIKKYNRNMPVPTDPTDKERIAFTNWGFCSYQMLLGSVIPN